MFIIHHVNFYVNIINVQKKAKHSPFILSAASIRPSIHPDSDIMYAYPAQGHREPGVNPRRLRCPRQATPWTGC